MWIFVEENDQRLQCPSARTSRRRAEEEAGLEGFPVDDEKDWIHPRVASTQKLGPGVELQSLPPSPRLLLPLFSLKDEPVGVLRLNFCD